MALGKKKARQEELFVATAELRKGTTNPENAGPSVAGSNPSGSRPWSKAKGVWHCPSIVSVTRDTRIWTGHRCRRSQWRE
jgi:hypothetical protein